MPCTVVVHLPQSGRTFEANISNRCPVLAGYTCSAEAEVRAVGHRERRFISPLKSPVVD